MAGRLVHSAIDEVAVSTVPGPGPYTFTTDSALAEGDHAVRVEVTDGRNKQSQAIGVTIRIGTVPPAGGSGGGDDASSSDVAGGCSTSGGAGLVAALGLLALKRRRYLPQT